MKLLLLSLFLAVASEAASQQALSLEDFLSLIKKYHPVARQAELGIKVAEAEVTAARAGFDPLLQTALSRKEVEGLLYYDHQVNEVRVPTLFGVDVVTGVERLDGQRTSTPDTKGASSYFGFDIPVAKGLLMDARRAALQEARIFRQLSLQEQRKVLNDLLFDAVKAYWNCWEHYQAQRLFGEALKNARQRFEMVKAAYRIGERPAIDTVEALAQWQGFQIRESEIALEVANSQLAMDVFLWGPAGVEGSRPPADGPQLTTSTGLDSVQIEQLLVRLQVHPEIQQVSLKQELLKVDKRLKFQSLLPSVYFKYRQLNGSHDLSKLISTPWLENNFRYGLSITMPLRLSEGRGEYRKAILKLKQTELEQRSKQAVLQAKVRQYYNEWRQTGNQVRLQRQALQSYAALQRGEERKFLNGESSLFLVNARELKTLEAQLKLAELQSKEQKAVAGLLWAAGLLHGE